MEYTETRKSINKLIILLFLKLGNLQQTLNFKNSSLIIYYN
jgi:hypothetical protein